MQTVLTIAGFDPSSGAGVTADLMVFAAHGLFGTACITALTVQSTQGVRSTHATSRSVVETMLECLATDLPPDGIKIGMLATDCNTLAVSDFIDKYKVKHSHTARNAGAPIVLDPVLRSTSGRELLEPAGVVALREQLLPQVDWVTPNLNELATLSGVGITHRDDLPGASQALQQQVFERSCRQRLGIFATGGHLDPPDDYLLLPSGVGFWLQGQRVVTRSTHGTGCALSSAFLSRLVSGDSPMEAAVAAKRYVAGALRNAIEIGQGHGPINHLWQLPNVRQQ